MSAHNILKPLCLSCSIALEHKVEIDNQTGISYDVDRCPNCGEIYNKWRVEN